MIDRERFVINSGVDGSNSQSINDNFDKWVKEFDPEIVSIMIGANEKVTPVEFEKNLREIIKKSQDINALVMLQTPVLQKDDISNYVDIILKVGKELNIPVVDHYNIWKNLEENNPHIKDTFLNKDYTLNHRGHLRVAQDMMKALGILDTSSVSSGSKVDMKYDSVDTTEKFKESLTEVINKSKKSIEDNKDNKYSSELKSALLADIEWAEREITKTNSTIRTVSNTINFLNNSLELFEKSVQKKEVSYGYDVNNDGLINIVDLSLVSKNYNKNSTDEEWGKIEIYDINKDKVINDIDLKEVMNKILKK